MIKKSNQEFITLNEPIIYFYLIDVIFFVHTLPLSNVKYYLKNKNGKSFVGRFEDIDFSCISLFFSIYMRLTF